MGHLSPSAADYAIVRDSHLFASLFVGHSTHSSDRPGTAKARIAKSENIIVPQYGGQRRWHGKVGIDSPGHVPRNPHGRAATTNDKRRPGSFTTKAAPTGSSPKNCSAMALVSARCAAPRWKSSIALSMPPPISPKLLAGLTMASQARSSRLPSTTST